MLLKCSSVVTIPFSSVYVPLADVPWVTCTGYLSKSPSTVDDVPSWLYVLSPHEYTWPSDVNARLCLLPAATATTFSIGWLSPTITICAAPEFSVVPLPSWPSSFRPHAHTWPSESTAKLWYPPAATSIIFSSKVYCAFPSASYVTL